jgi:hypothetical protein
VTLPTTTAALKAWLVDVTLSTVAADLSWTSASAPVEAAVDLTALVLGHTVETEASSGATQKLIDIATWRAWEQAVQALARNFDAKSGGARAKLSQAYDHATPGWPTRADRLPLARGGIRHARRPAPAGGRPDHDHGAGHAALPAGSK